MGSGDIPGLHDRYIYPAEIVHPVVTPSASSRRDDVVGLVCRQIAQTTEQVRQLEFCIRSPTWGGDG